MNMKLKNIVLIAVFLFVLTSCKEEAVLDGTESSVSQTGDIKKIQVITPTADIRSGCSNNAAVLDTADQNAKYEVINKVNDWYAVQLPDNSIGFIPEKQAKPIVDATTPVDMPSVAQRTPAAPTTPRNPTTVGTKQNNANTNGNGTTAPNNNNNNTNNKDAANTNTNSTSLSAAEQQMVTLVNKAREENNLPALKVDTTLANVARTKAKDMIDNNYFSHNSPTYGSPFDMMKSFSIKYIKAGENIAGNQTVQAAHDALMKSPGHRANILSSDYTHIGIGIVEGGSYGNMFTQMFISK
ncbi:MAG: serine protease [Firmicutes bacterium HGW-Firmicutes-1]|nr:MAG: serine protease [Firmicutes bacterium HGW-Firmicutes-1]